MKKITAILAVIMVAVLGFTACTPEVTPLSPSVERFWQGTLVYNVSVMKDDGTVSYTYPATYTFSKDQKEGKEVLVVHSDGSYTNDAQETLASTITSTLSADPETGLFLPLSVYQTYTNSVQVKSNVTVKTEHNQSAKSISVTVNAYASTEDTQPTDKLYTIKGEKEYYDAESLFAMVGALPLEEGFEASFLMSSSNAQNLQSMKMKVLATEEIKVDAGTYTAYAVELRPNTVFANYSAIFYFAKDYGNALLKISQPTVTMQLATPLENNE